EDSTDRRRKDRQLARRREGVRAIADESGPGGAAGPAAQRPHPARAPRPEPSEAAAPRPSARVLRALPDRSPVRRRPAAPRPRPARAPRPEPSQAAAPRPSARVLHAPRPEPSQAAGPAPSACVLHAPDRSPVRRRPRGPAPASCTLPDRSPVRQRPRGPAPASCTLPDRSPVRRRPRGPAPASCTLPDRSPVSRRGQVQGQFSKQLSQFWYSQETALQLAKEAITAAGEGGRIACVSAPSVYQKLRELHREDFSVYIFEYDKRFAIYGEEFIFYDYNNPLDLPEKIAAHSFDIVIADPPYLSEECLRKTSETIKYLTQGKILLCTGAVMQEEAAKLLGVKMCKFIPEHTRTLANEFRCYVNYDSGLDHEI
uniref:EEF1A lysine methyltransferase 1 n=1 Tax=Equus asinus TaxID=9793 RepID=A0A9L0JZU3_EQUAS